MAGAMGHAAVEELAHALEDALGRLRDAGEGAARAARQPVADALDAVEDAVEASIAPGSIALDRAALDAAIASLGAGRGDALCVEQVPPDSESRAAPSRTPAAGDGRAVAVAASALDRLLDLAGELASLRDRLAHSAARTGDAALARTAADLGRVSGAFAEEVRSARLVSVGELFAELPLVVRQAARASGKQVALETSGGSVVADRAVLDALGEPLMHLLRNAVDHGIEPAPERERAGKHAAGRISVSADRDGRVLVVRVEDDGRGVDRVAVLARARARGDLPTSAAHPGTTIDDDALLRYLAVPGLSTAATVGRVSGRGVGVDAALARIRALGGEISLRTTAGAGTTFELRMPLSWAVVPVLIVRAGGAAYALPLAHVVGSRAARPDEHAPALAVLLGGGVGDTRCDHPSDADADADADVVVLAGAPGASHIAVTVDEVVGVRDCVLKPVAAPRGAFRIAAGATILDAGEVALVLDVPAVAARSATPAPAATRPPPCPSPPLHHRP